MRHLLDINVLIALMDPDHAFHQRAHAWWAAQPRAWASCPLTENGLLRIMAASGYSNNARFTIQDIGQRLAHFANTTDHAFWPDSLTLRDTRHFRFAAMLSSRHLTDLYLLALAVDNQGCLITFDTHIPLSAVPTATTAQLQVI